MNLGFSCMIPKPNDKIRSGTRTTHRARRKQEMSKSQIKSTLICFSDSQGVVLKEFVPKGQTLNQQFLQRLRKGFIASGQRLRTLRCCITLPYPWTNFWPKSVFQWFRSPHTRLIWVRVTSFFSRNSNSTSKVVILELWTTSKRSWQTSWGHFHMKTSSTATGSASNVSDGVWLAKGPTLKGITLICSSIVNKKYHSTSLITF